MYNPKNHIILPEKEYLGQGDVMQRKNIPEGIIGRVKTSAIKSHKDQ